MKYETIIQFEQDGHLGIRTATFVGEARSFQEATDLARVTMIGGRLKILSSVTSQAPEEEADPTEYGMFSDAGNQYVTNAVQEVNNLSLTDARYLVALGHLASLKTDYPEYGEVTDTDVRDRVFEAIKQRANREARLGKKFLEFILPLIKSTPDAHV